MSQMIKAPSKARAFLAVLLLVSSARANLAGASPLKVGAAVPDFTLTRLDGKTVKVSQLGKKVILVNFWASWCAPCLTELPSIQSLRIAYKDRGFEVVAVNSDEDPKTAIPQVLSKLRLEVPLYVDPKGTLSESFGITAFPYSMVLDSKRKVLFLESRERDWNSAEIRTKLESWLK